MAITSLGGTAFAHVISATTIVSAAPSGLQDGDLLLAFVFHRTALTPPSGWTVVEETGLFESGTLDQYLSAVKKDTVTASDAAANFTWTQASAARLGVTYFAARGAWLAETSSGIVTLNGDYVISPPALTAAQDGELFLLAASTILTATSGTVSPSQPAGSTLWTGGSAEQYRLIGAYQARNTGQSNSGSFDCWPSTDTTTNGLGAITLRLAPQVTANFRGMGTLGAAAITANTPAMGWVIGAGILGAPRIVVNGPSAQLQGVGLLGAPLVTAWHGVTARLAGMALLGPPSLRVNHPRPRATLLAPGLLGTPRGSAWSLPAPAAVIPPGVTYYFCKLTGAPDGLPDLILPISSFSVRHRPDAPSYYQITIPSYAYVSDLAARPNGEIVIWSEQAGVSEELARGDLGQVAIARGPKSQSISISGNADRAELPHLTYVIPEALYVASSFSGDTRLRIEPRARIRPGDYVRYQDLNMAVGEVTWAVSVSAGGLAATMELVSIPVESGA